MKHLTITKPDDWHVHFRDGDMLSDTVNATAQHFGRALVMPNLNPPLTDRPLLQAYEARVKRACRDTAFQPYFTLYINESVSPDTLIDLKAHNTLLGCKLYPKGATTHSEAGTADIKKLFPLFEVMQSLNYVLQIHGEVTHSDIFDREALFLSEWLQPIIENFPKLRIVLEHISTKASVDFILSSPANVAATITPHHLIFNRNDLLAGGIRPHFYCLPILKRESDRVSLLQAATSNNHKFFAGTDSAPHAIENKINPCGCAGLFNAPVAMNYYAQAFELYEKLHHLENFTSKFGADFYQLPQNTQKIELLKHAVKIPDILPLGKSMVVPMGAGQTLNWMVVNDKHE